MGFQALLGNGQLKENLTAALRKNRISHGYLITGPRGAGKKTLAKLLSAGAMCDGKEKPCGVCTACRKVLSGVHPDVITVDDPDRKTVGVDVIRKARADCYIQPNEGKRKIYVIPRAQDMGVEAQNALLKVLEEPPAYAMFLLLAETGEALLPTIRSRCVELKLQALSEEVLRKALTQAFPKATPEEIDGAMGRSGGYLGQAKELLTKGTQTSPQTRDFLESYARGDGLLLQKTLVGMEKWKRDQLISELQQWRQKLIASLACRSGGAAEDPACLRVSQARSPAQVRCGVAALEKAIEYAGGNVSVAAICGWLFWELRKEN